MEGADIIGCKYLRCRQFSAVPRFSAVLRLFAVHRLSAVFRLPAVPRFSAVPRLSAVCHQLSVIIWLWWYTVCSSTVYHIKSEEIATQFLQNT